MKDTDIIAAIAPDAVSLMDKAIAEIKRLRQENATLTAERDEARREVCVAREAMVRMMIYGDVAVPQEAMHQAAKARGWDCFKEKTDE